MRPSPPWDSRAATSRCRQAARNSSWVQDSARARSASRGTDSRSVGAFSARVRNAISAAVSRAAVLAGHHADAPVQAERGVVVGQRPDLDLGLGCRPQDRDPLAAQRLRRGDVRRVGDGLVPGPGPLVVGDQAARRRATRTRARSAVTSIRRPITAGWTE